MAGDQNDPLGILSKPTSTEQSKADTSADPLGVLKKKDVTTSSTSSSSVQLPGFVQQQQLDLTGVTSSSPSTTQSPKLPNVIYNQNLYTGTKPTTRGAYSPTQGDILNATITTDATIQPGGSGPYTYNWSPENTGATPVAQVAATNTVSGQVDTQPFIKGGQEYAFNQRLIQAKKEATANKIEFAKANPGVPVEGVSVDPFTQEVTVTETQTPLEKAREFGNYYMLNTDPATLKIQNERIDYFNTPDAIKNEDDALNLQRAIVMRDQNYLNLYNNALVKSMEVAEKTLEDSYGPQALAYNEAAQGMASWPKDPSGQPIINTQEEANQYNTWRETVVNLSANEGFMNSVSGVITSENDLRGAWLAQQDLIRQNPLYYIEQDKAKAKAQEQEAKLSGALPSVAWRIKNIDNPFANAVVDFAVGLAYIPKAFGDAESYGWTDAFYEHDYNMAQESIRPYLPQENGLVANIVSSATTMGLMIGTGYAMGAVGGGSRIAMMAGQVTSGTVATMEGYYRAGLEAGMSESDAEKYSVVSGVVQGALEMINPEAAFTGTLARRSAQAYAKALAEGATKQMAFRESAKVIGKNILGENIQEFTQQFAEWGINMKANQITGASLDTGDQWKTTLAETAVITTLLSAVVGGIQSGGIRSNQNKLVGETLYVVGSSPDVYRTHTAKMLERGEITAEKAAEINTKIDEAVEVKAALPSYMKPEEAVKLAPGVLEKVRLQKELKAVDDAFKPDVEQKIQQVEEQIQKEAGIKTEEQQKEEAQVRVAEMDELGDLKVSEQMGTLDDAEKERLEELKKKHEEKLEVPAEPEPVVQSSADVASVYKERLQKAKQENPEAFWSVDQQDDAVIQKAAEEGRIVDEGGVMGIVKDDGDIVGLFKYDNTQKGGAQKVIKKLIEKGATKLDNFDGYLTKIYEQAGFRVVSRVPFNEEYAPPGWNKETHGTPDVVGMVYDPDGKITEEAKVYESYDEAMAVKDKLASFVSEGSSPQQSPVVAPAQETQTTEEVSTEPARPKVNPKEEISQELADEEIPDNAIDDDAVVSKLDDDLKIIKTLSASGVGMKAKAVDQRIEKAVKEGKLTQDTADKYTKAFNDVVTGRVGEIKDAATKKIDEVTDQILRFGKKVGVIGPNTMIIDGKEVPISKNSMVDVEALVKMSSDLLKRAVSRGIDVQVAFGNMKAAIVSHPRYKRLIASGELTPEQYDKMVMQDYEKVAEDIQKLQAELDQKQHRFSETFETIEKFLDPILREEFKKNGLKGYVPQGMEMQWGDAGKWIEGLEKMGEIDHAIDVIKDMSNGMQAAVRVMIGNRILEHYVKKARAAVTEEEKMAASKKVVSIMNIMEKAGEDVGRALGNYRKTKEIIMDMAGPEVATMIVGEELKQAAERESNTRSSKKEAKEISEEAKKIEGEIKTQEQKTKAAEKLLEKLRNKFNHLDEAGKRQLAFKMVDELSEKGLLSAQSIRKMYAEVLGEKLFTPEKQKFIREQAEIAQKFKQEEAGYNDKLKALKEQYLEDIKGKSRSEVKKITKNYRVAISDAANSLQKHMFQAQMAHEKISKEMQGPRDIYSSLRWGIRFGMLGVHSTVINVFSNAFMGSPRFGGATLASIWDAATTPIWRIYGNKRGWGQEVTRTHSLLSQIKSIYQGAEATKSNNPLVRAASAVYGGLKPTLRELYYRTWKGVPDPAFMDKLNEHRNVKVVDAWIDLAKKRKVGVTTLRDIEGRLASLYEGTFGIHGVPIMRLMAAGDILFKRPYYAAKLHEIATTRKGLKTSDEISDFMANPDEHSKAEASEWAKRQVFQQEKMTAAGINKIFKKVNYELDKIIEGASDGNSNEFVRHVVGLTSLIKTASFPFVSTMINMMPEFVTLAIPAVGFTSAIKKSFQAASLYEKSTEVDRTTAQGKADYDKLIAEAGRKRNEAASDVGKGIVSTMVMTVALELAARSLITGKADDDEKVRNWEYMNIKPYSINYSALKRWVSGDEDWASIRPTDEWVGYNQLGPIGTAMGTWATGYRTGSAMKSADSTAQAIQMLTGAFPEIVSQAMDMSFMKGTSMMIEGFASGGDKFERWYNNTLFGLSTAIFPNDLGTFIKSKDEFMRDTKPAPEHDYHDRFLNKWSEQTGNYEELPMKINAFGDPVKRVPEGVDPMLYMFMSPTRPYEVNTESAGYQIYKTWSQMPDGSAKNAIIPPVVDWYVSVKVKGDNTSSDIMLTPTEHELIQILIGKEREKLANNYVFSDEWDNDSNQLRSERLSNIWETAKKTAVDDFILSSPRIQNIKAGIPVEESFE